MLEFCLPDVYFAGKIVYLSKTACIAFLGSGYIHLEHVQCFRVFVKIIFCLTENLNQAHVVVLDFSCGGSPFFSFGILLVVNQSPAKDDIGIKVAGICGKLVLTYLYCPLIITVAPFFKCVRLSLSERGRNDSQCECDKNSEFFHISPIPSFLRWS